MCSVQCSACICSRCPSFRSLAGNGIALWVRISYLVGYYMNDLNHFFHCRTLTKLKNIQSDGNEKPTDGLTSMINKDIDEIKVCCSIPVFSFTLSYLSGMVQPSFIGNEGLKRAEGLSKILDVTMGPTIDTLNMFKNASSFIPVPWVQPLIGTVVNMLQAVSVSPKSSVQHFLFSLSSANSHKLQTNARNCGRCRRICCFLCCDMLDKHCGASTWNLPAQIFQVSDDSSLQCYLLFISECLGPSEA